MLATAMMNVLLIPHSKKTWRVILDTGEFVHDTMCECVDNKWQV